MRLCSSSKITYQVACFIERWDFSVIGEGMQKPPFYVLIRVAVLACSFPITGTKSIPLGNRGLLPLKLQWNKRKSKEPVFINLSNQQKKCSPFGDTNCKGHLCPVLIDGWKLWDTTKANLRKKRRNESLRPFFKKPSNCAVFAYLKYLSSRPLKALP